jgi:hypothetical protein
MHNPIPPVPTTPAQTTALAARLRAILEMHADHLGEALEAWHELLTDTATSDSSGGTALDADLEAGQMAIDQIHHLTGWRHP